MKVVLEFNLPEEKDEYQTAMNGQRYYSNLWDVRQEIFRPARKHGYGDDSEIQKVLESLGGNGYRLMELLEARFSEIVDGTDI